MIETKFKYSCSECDYKWESEIKLDDPICPKCFHSKDNNIKKYKPMSNLPNITYFNNCTNCSNNPTNGGSGIIS